MSEPKPVELTEAERDEITRLFGYMPDNEPLEFMLAAVTRIKAAARREALLDHASWLEANAMPMPVPYTVHVAMLRERAEDQR